MAGLLDTARSGPRAAWHLRLVYSRRYHDLASTHLDGNLREVVIDCNIKVLIDLHRGDPHAHARQMKTHQAGTVLFSAVTQASAEQHGADRV